MWKYYPIINFGLATLGLLAAGYLSVLFKFAKKEHIPVIVNFVFKVALPATVCQAIGFRTDLYEDGIWKFIGSFLILRLFMLILVVAWNALGWLAPLVTSHPWVRAHVKGGSVGDVAAEWLATTWISTVILGAPVVAAAYQTELGGYAFATRYGVLSGIASWVFQLPLMLFLFEAHKARVAPTADIEQPTNPPTTTPGPTKGTHTDPPMEAKVIATDPAQVIPSTDLKQPFLRTYLRVLGSKLFHNNIIWALVIGFIISLSTLRKFLEPPLPEIPSPVKELLTYTPNPAFPGGHFINNWTTLDMAAFMEEGEKPGVKAALGFALKQMPNMTLPNFDPDKQYWNSTHGLTDEVLAPDFVVELQFIDDILSYLGDCATPLTMFATGMWMFGRNPFRAKEGLLKILFFLAIKLIFVPFLMIPIALMFDLKGAEAKSAVLIAAVPIAQASFALASEYKVQQDLIASCVFFGTILLLPTTLIFVAILDHADIFADA